jgi:hypothetical protein
VASDSTSRNVLRERIYGHLSFWFVIWPLFTFCVAILESGENPLTQLAPARVAAAGAAVGILALWPEFLFCALLLTTITVLLFTFAGSRKPSTLELLLEAMIGAVALSLGVALQFPVILDNPMLGLLRSHSVLTVTFILIGILLLLALLLGFKARRWQAFATAPAVVGGLMALGFGFTLIPTYVPSTHPADNNIVLVGLDSMSQKDDVGYFNRYAIEHGGTVYPHAITPGLLTNAVWTSIIMNRPVHETKVVFTFQTADWNRGSFQLIREAEKAGFETWSFFTDQFTSYVGTTGGFDYDRSSPMGWRQISTSSVKNASVLVPIMVSRVPHLPFSTTRANQANTYCYNLHATIRKILTAGTGQRPAFVAAHVEYLHQTAYPGMQQLNPHERSLVRHAPVNVLQDTSLDWYAPETRGEPLDINTWKEAYLQRVLAEEIETSGFLKPERHNRLVLFSDHGHRGGLDNDNFGDPRYFNVLLTTFGVPVLGDPQAPISLLEVHRLLGFSDPSRPEMSAPITEYVNLSTLEFKEATGGAKLKLDGRVDMPREILSASEQRLKAFRPINGDYYFVYPGTTSPVAGATGIMSGDLQK